MEIMQTLHYNSEGVEDSKMVLIVNRCKLRIKPLKFSAGRGSKST